MKSKLIRPRLELLQDRAVIQAAIAKGTREAVLAHARAGHSIPVYRNGKVIWIPPEEILARHGQEPPTAS